MWKIAIVDDDFQVLRGLRRAIPWDELEAEFVGDAIDGEAGIRLIEETNPDIVITDIYMPGMNGIEMIEALRKREFPGRFIILSGYNDFEFARTAIRLGVEDYLTKPGTVEQIREVLASTIVKLEASYLHNIERNVLESRKEALDGMTDEEWLAAVVTGQAIASELPASKAAWKSASHLVMVLEVVRTERIRGVTFADWNLFQFAVTNIASELLGQHWPDSDFVWLFGNHAAIVLHADAAADADLLSERAESIGLLIAESMRKYIDLEVRFGLGSVKQAWGEIKLSADLALQSLFALGEGEAEAGASSAASAAGAERGSLSGAPGTPGTPGTSELSGPSGTSEPSGSPEALAVSPKHKKAVDFMVRYIHEHYAEDLTLEELAGQLYISKNYLNQLFKKVTGETLTNYIIRVRIEKAKALLYEGHHLVYEVADMVGYQNVPYFTTLFKKYCGVTPSEFVRQEPKP
ncbi:response regulator transcription factor [Cohnella fermenti]|uniref:Response regulator n=1 Tax=Cohnella fermenti TaxID=2565925 RepID=A0A4S4BSA8_9BACL|nr:response regulator [Cohnella fermenti]THF77749.1 response regulator [Cohnella fermenti]